MLIDKFKLKHIEGEKLLVKSLEDKIIPEEKKKRNNHWMKELLKLEAGVTITK